MEDVNESSRTELDSHANMPVIGRNAYILSKIGETVDVAPFTPDYKPISVELVDAALKYECPYSGKVKILIIRRGLHVPSMTHNLIPPSMLREAGIQINEVPKIHVTSPTEEHHAIIFQETNFQIPLTLHGTFSYFPTSKPTTQELEEPEDVYVLAPTTWSPHSDAYVMNEESMLDWEGNMKGIMRRELCWRIFHQMTPGFHLWLYVRRNKWLYHPILFIKMKTSMLHMVLRMNTNYTMP